MNPASYDIIARHLADPDSALHLLLGLSPRRRRIFAVTTYWLPRLLWSAAAVPLFPFWYLGELVRNHIMDAIDSIDGLRAVEEFIAERERRRRDVRVEIVFNYRGPRAIEAPSSPGIEIAEFADRWQVLLGGKATEAGDE